MESKLQSKKNAPTALNKAVKNINKLIGDGDISLKSAISAKFEEVNSRPTLSKHIGPKKTRGIKLFADRGVVYLAHIPHGFYEEEMKAFFSQFGHVTRIRLVRSHKTGNSRGYAFIEFRFVEVAKVVADTMNNYLFGNRILKAVFIPPEKQSPKMFIYCTNYGPETCVGVKRRREVIALQNKPLTEEMAQVRIDKNKKHLLELQEKLKAQGVDCLFQVESSSSKGILEEPTSKRARTSSPTPTPRARSSKQTQEKQSSTGPTLKKKPTIKKGQMSQKTVKSVKSVKLAEKGSKKPSGVEKAVEKNSVKGPVPKKVVKKVVKKTNVAKVMTSKKDVTKKSVTKKQAAKKK